MIATLMLTAALVPPCPLHMPVKHKHHALPVAPLESCVLPPALPVVRDEAIDPVLITGHTRYIILESAVPDPYPITCGSVGYNFGGGGTVRTTRAPEMDPSSAASGLTLLFGALAVMRGRK